MTADDAWNTFAPADGLAGEVVRAISIDGSGGKWFGTNEGLSYLNDAGTPQDRTDDLWITYTIADGLVNNDVSAIAIDSSGGIWCGTTGQGVSYLDNNGTPTNKSDDRWITFTAADGLNHNGIYSIMIDSLNQKWFGTREGSCYLDDNGTPLVKRDDSWVTVSHDRYTEPYRVLAVALDDSGGKWMVAGTLYYCP